MKKNVLFFSCWLLLLILAIIGFISIMPIGKYFGSLWPSWLPKIIFIIIMNLILLLTMFIIMSPIVYIFVFVYAFIQNRFKYENSLWLKTLYMLSGRE